MRKLLCTILLALLTATAASEEIGLLELFNYYEYSPALASSGQPKREQLPAIAAAGIDAVISLVPDDSPGAYADEGELIKQLGMDFVHIPIVWEAPTRDDLRGFFAAMERFAGKRILVHCYANARASAFVYLWRVLKAGDDREQAHRTLVTIWDWNEGYELRNEAVWSQFIAEATATPD